MPASTRVQVASLDGPNLLIEIDAIAVINNNLRPFNYGLSEPACGKS